MSGSSVGSGRLPDVLEEIAPDGDHILARRDGRLEADIVDSEGGPGPRDERGEGVGAPTDQVHHVSQSRVDDTEIDDRFALQQPDPMGAAGAEGYEFHPGRPSRATPTIIRTPARVTNTPNTWVSRLPDIERASEAPIWANRIPPKPMSAA